MHVAPFRLTAPALALIRLWLLPTVGALSEHASQHRQAVVVGESLVQDPHARVRF
jgi:hypothetical protein